MQRAPLHGDGPEDVDEDDDVPRFGDRADNVAAVLHHGTEIDQLNAIDQMAGIGQREQPEVANQRREPVEVDGQLGGQAGVIGLTAFVAQADVDGGAHGGNRRLELVRGVGRETTGTVHRAFETIEHAVQRLHETIELFAAGAHVETFFEAAGLDRADALDDGIHWSQRPTRDEASAVAGGPQHQDEPQQHSRRELTQDVTHRIGRPGDLEHERGGARPPDHQRDEPQSIAERVVDIRQAVTATCDTDGDGLRGSAELGKGGRPKDDEARPLAHDDRFGRQTPIVGQRADGIELEQRRLNLGEDTLPLDGQFRVRFFVKRSRAHDKHENRERREGAAQHQQVPQRELRPDALRRQPGADRGRHSRHRGRPGSGSDRRGRQSCRGGASRKRPRRCWPVRT